MTGLVEFLKARLHEDEQVARFVIDGPGEVIRRGLDLQRIEIDGKIRYAFLTLDPERMLSEVDAKRRLIDLHPHGVWPTRKGDGHLHCETCDVEDGVIGGDGRYCLTLRLLALPFASHPEYDESWRP